MQAIAPASSAARGHGRPLRPNGRAGRSHVDTCTGGRAAGFTLLELIVILLLLGVLTVVAVPRLVSDDLRVPPVAERIAAEIRYAQALAMTHGEAHQFRIGGGSFWITSGDGGCAGGGASVALSDGNGAGSYQGLNVTLDGSSTGCLSFSSLFGTPDGSHSLQVTSGGNSASIQVTSGTGYVQVQA